MMATAIKAKVTKVKSSHVVMLSHPDVVAKVIISAAEAAEKPHALPSLFDKTASEFSRLHAPAGYSRIQPSRVHGRLKQILSVSDKITPIGPAKMKRCKCSCETSVDTLTAC
jgi:hypothetical protein